MGAYNDAEKEAIPTKPQSIHEIHTDQLRRKFIKLPYAQKEFIRKVQGEGFEWKGEDTHEKLSQLDDLTHFEHAYREWKLMKEVGLEQYRKDALARLDSYTRRSVGRAVRQ